MEAGKVGPALLCPPDCYLLNGIRSATPEPKGSSNVETYDDDNMERMDFKLRVEALKVRAKASPRSPGPLSVRANKEEIKATLSPTKIQVPSSPKSAIPQIPADQSSRSLNSSPNLLGKSSEPSPEEDSYEDDYEQDTDPDSTVSKMPEDSTKLPSSALDDHALELSYSLDVRPPQSPFALSGNSTLLVLLAFLRLYSDPLS